MFIDLKFRELFEKWIVYNALWLNCIYNFSSFLQAFKWFAYILEEEEKGKRAADWWKFFSESDLINVTIKYEDFWKQR